MNVELRKNAKNNFEKIFFKLMNNAVRQRIVQLVRIMQEKTMENVRKHSNIKLVKTEARWNYLISEPNVYTTNIFSDDLTAIEMKRTQILRNKPVFLHLSILQISKIVMYEFWYVYVKPKYGETANLCYIHTGSFVVYMKRKDIMQTLRNMLKQDLILEIKNQASHYLKEKFFKNWINET